MIFWPSANVASAPVPVLVTVKVQLNGVPTATVPLTSFVFEIVRSGFSVLVNVQVTFSPASTLNVAMPVPVLPLLGLVFVSSQTMLVSSQFDGTVSAAVKVPG